MNLLTLGIKAFQYAPRAMAGVRSLLSDPVKSTGLVTGGILGGKATEETINSGILGNSNMIQEGMNFFSSPAINFLNDIRNTPSGSIVTPDQGAIDAENKFNEELNKKITTATQDNQSNILITPEVEQPSGLLTTPEIDPLDFSNTTPMPDQSLLSDYILTAEEAPETEEGLLSESSNPYYSVLAEAVLDMNFNSGSGQQILNQINNMPGIKQSEIVDTGLDNFLSSKDKVTKEELDNYILENNISTKITDTFLSDGGVLVGGKMDITPDYLRNAPTMEKAIQLVQNRGELYDDFIRLGEQGLFGSAGEGVSFNEFISDSDMETEKELIQEYLEVRHNLRQVSGVNTEYQDYTLQGGKNYQEMLITVPTEGRSYIPKHFYNKIPDGENLIAHARFNERVINGKKTLFIEEIQSDLHQKGRKEGYGFNIDMSPAVNKFNSYLETIKERYPELANSDSYLGLQSDVKALSEANSIEIANGIKKDIPFYLNDLNDELEEAGYNEAKDGFKLKSNNEFFRDVDTKTEIKGVPDAPFKKNWHELTMKRLIKYAVDNGFEAISFTSGKMQNERYDLSKYIDNVEVTPSLKAEGKIFIKAYGKGYGSQVYHNHIYPNQLEEYVGKELSEKILKDIEDSNNFNNFNLKEYLSQPQEDNSGADFIKNNALVYNDTDLEVGGEGMIGFYDNMLPKFLSKYGKKYGSTLEQANIPGIVEQARRPGNIQVEEVYDAVGQSGNVFASYEIKMIKDPATGMNEKYQVIQTKDGVSNVIAETRNAIESKKIIIDELEGFDVPQFFERKENVPFMLITPEMKEEIGKKGITLAKLNSGLLSVA